MVCDPITKNETKGNPQRKRGRPKKKAPQLPEFKTSAEIRQYLLNLSLSLTLELKENASKKNNIKRADIANAKTQQYKSAIAAVKLSNSILNDIQINDIENQIKTIAEHINKENNNNSVSSETITAINNLTELTKEIKARAEA